jgi:hypothetical protein
MAARSDVPEAGRQVRHDSEPDTLRVWHRLVIDRH